MSFGRISSRKLAQRLKKAARLMAFYYPFTAAGSLLLVFCLYLLGSSFATRNPYNFLLSAVGCFVLFVLVLLGRLQASRFTKVQAVWESAVPLFARLKGLSHRLVNDNAKSLPFFRLHFCLGGRITVGREAFLRYRQETPGRGGTMDVPLFFPLSGIFHASAHLKVRDIFGLTRIRFGEGWSRQLVIRPALLPDREFYSIEALDGLEEKSKVKQSDMERYFMREYIPGDRARDINWKASSRVLELITRISPVTQEKTQVLTVILRAYRKARRETVESIGHLNFVKSWLLLFLKVLKKQHPEFQFRIIAADTVHLLENEEEINRFAEELSGIFFRSPVAGLSAVAAAQNTGRSEAPASGGGDLFVFSTPYDITLGTDLALMSGSRIHLFRTRTPDTKAREAVGRQFPLFPAWPHLLYPRFWFLRRDGSVQNPSPFGQVTGRLEEEVLEVRLV